MKKILLPVAALILGVNSMQADEALAMQYRSMELGPWDFSPSFFYGLTHHSYSGAKMKRWLGIPLLSYTFHEDRSNVKRVGPRRLLEAGIQQTKIAPSDNQQADLFKVYLEEAFQSLDRNTDNMYRMYEADFKEMQGVIKDYLAYVLTVSGGKEAINVNALLDANTLLCQSIAYVRMTGPGYELENEKRRASYEAYKKNMQEIVDMAYSLALTSHLNYK